MRRGRRALRPRPRERGTVDEFREALDGSIERVGDERGVVAPRSWLPARTLIEDRDEPGDEWSPARAPARAPSAIRRWDHRLVRALNAALAAGATWWLAGHLLTSAPLAPLALALVAAAVALFAPRVGVVVTALALGGLAAAQGRPGGALVIIAVLGVTAAAMPLEEGGWALPGGAVLLGVVSLAGAWPAIVARSRTRWWSRGAVAGLGFVWLAAAGALSNIALYERLRPVPSASTWTTSGEVTVHDLLPAVLHSGVFAGAAVWAAAAVCAPILIRGRSRAGTVAIAVASGVVTVVATEFVLRAFAGPGHDATPFRAFAGALAGSAILALPAFRSGETIRPTSTVP